MAEISTIELDRLYNQYNDKDVFSLFIGNGENRFEFEVKHRLNADEVTSIITYVLSRIFDTNTGVYHPELKDYFLRMAVLNTYTNIILPKGDESWKLVYGTPVFAMIIGHDRRPVVFNGRDYDDNMVIDVEQYEQLVAAIDQRITYDIIQSILTGIANSNNTKSNNANNSEVKK